MVRKLITLPTNNEKVYLQILSFFNFALELTNQERDVLSELIKLNHEYEALPADKRAKFILSTDMRKELREKLEMEEGSFNGIISRLKKKTFFGTPIIGEDNVINENLLFKPDEEGFEIKIVLENKNQPTPIVHEQVDRSEVTILNTVRTEERVQENISPQHIDHSE